MADNELANVQTLISKASGPEIVLNPLKINADSFTVEPTFYDTHGPAIVLPNQLPSDEDIKASALFALDPVAQVAPSTFSPQHTAVYRLSTSNNITSISTYSADPSLWQTSSTFTNLQPNTQYYLYAQAIESRNFFEGPISQLLLVSTDSKGSPTLSILPNQKGFLAQTGDIPQFLIEGTLILFLAFLINEKKKRDKEENLTNDE